MPLRGGAVEVSFTLPVDPPREGAEGPTAGPASFSPGWASMKWHDGTVYAFTPRQRVVMTALWHARDNGHEWVGQEALLEMAESFSGRLRNLFRGHAASGGVIESALPYGGPPGAYRLAPRPNSI